MKKIIQRRKSQVTLNLKKIQERTFIKNKDKTIKELNKYQKGQIIDQIKKKLQQQQYGNEKNSKINQKDQNINYQNIINNQLEKKFKRCSVASKTQQISKVSKQSRSNQKKSIYKSRSQIKLSSIPSEQIKRKSISPYQSNWNFISVESEKQRIKQNHQIILKKKIKSIYEIKSKSKQTSMEKNSKHKINKTKQQKNLKKLKMNNQNPTNSKIIAKPNLKLPKAKKQEISKSKPHEKSQNIYKNLQKIQKKKVNKQKQFSDESFDTVIINDNNDQIQNLKMKTEGFTISSSEYYGNFDDQINIIVNCNEEDNIKDLNRQQVKVQQIECKKQLENNNNSLITIKDFNQQKSVQKNIEKNNSVNQEWLLLLQDLLKEETLEKCIKQKIKRAINKRQIQDKSEKKIYIEQKIKDEILSERQFNSPKSNIKPFNSDIAFKSPLKPISQIISNKKKEVYLNSPFQSSPKSFLSSKKKIAEQWSQIKPNQQSSNNYHHFDSSFEFIEQFCISIFTYIKQNVEQRQNLINTIKQLKDYQLKLVLADQGTIEVKFQNNEQNQYIPLFAFSQNFKHPSIFNSITIQNILESQFMKSFLTLYSYPKAQPGTIQHHYLMLLFDCLSEAAYYQLKNYPLSIYSKLRSNPDEYFYSHLIASMMVLIHQWSHMYCGMQASSDNEKQATAILNNRITQELVQQSMRKYYRECQNHQKWILKDLTDAIFLSEIQQFSLFLIH